MTINDELGQHHTLRVSVYTSTSLYPLCLVQVPGKEPHSKWQASSRGVVQLSPHLGALRFILRLPEMSRGRLLARATGGAGRSTPPSRKTLRLPSVAIAESLSRSLALLPCCGQAPPPRPAPGQDRNRQAAKSRTRPTLRMDDVYLVACWMSA